MSAATRFRFYTATSLDGFLADTADSLDWLLSQPIDEDGPMNYAEFIGDVGALAMGSTTYEWLVEHEVEQGNLWPYEVPTFVFSTRDLTPVADTVRVVSGSPADHRAALVDAAAGRDVWIVGGGDLAAQFWASGMLDELVVSIAPVLLGSGRPLFTARCDLELRDLARNQGFVCARYGVTAFR